VSVEPLVGRGDELDRLRALFAEVEATGAGRFVIVTGEAGSGKTRLCTEYSRHLADGGIPVVLSRCWDGGEGPPLWPWPDLVARLAGQGHEMPASTSESRNRFDVFQAVSGRLRELCTQRPAVVLIDDLHAANRDVLLLTRFIARSLHRFPMLLVATWRFGQSPAVAADEQFDSLVRESTVLDLTPFGEEEIFEYLRACGRSATPAEISALLAVTAGNPLYVTEAVRRPSLRSWSGAESLARAIAQRVAKMERSQYDIVGAAAILGESATVCSVAAMLRRSPADVIAAIDDVGVWVSIRGHEIRFSHDLVRRAFTDAMTTIERQQMHAAAMGEITSRDVDQVVRRARHAVEAAGLSREHALAAVDASAQAAMSLNQALAFEQAVEWAARGCDLAVEVAPPAVEAKLWLAHADAVLASGRLTEARRLYERAVRPATRANDPRLLALAAIGLGGVWVEEQRDELSRRRMLALCRRARRSLPADESLLAARLTVRLAAEDVYQGRRDDEITSAVEAVRRHGDPATTAEALSLYHHTLLVPDHAHDRLRIAEELLDVTERPEAAMYSLFGLCWRTVDLYLLGDPGADSSFVELREHATALGSQSLGYVASVLEVMRTFRRGELDETERLAAEALDLGTAAGDADALSWFGGHLLAIRWAQGRLEEMHDLVAAVIESSTLRRLDQVYPALLAYTAALRGDVSAARSAVSALLAEDRGTTADFSTWTTTMMVLAETAAELGDTDSADTIAQRFAPYAHLPVMPALAVICLGPGERVLATAHMAAGRLDDAVAWLRAALTANQRLGNRPFEALILAQLASVLARRRLAGDRAEAADLYASAIALGDQMKMSERVSRWKREAAELGGAPRIAAALPGTLEERGDTWYVEIGGRSTTIGRLSGMRYVAELISRPDTAISAHTLSAAASGLPGEVSLGSDRALDVQARRHYQQRLAQLDHELDTADVVGDAGRSQRAAIERDQIIQQLRSDVGLGGRPRRLNDDAERSRMRVSKAIQRAIRQIETADPVLGRALQTRIHTGFFCRYIPDPGQPITWTVQKAPATRAPTADRPSRVPSGHSDVPSSR
jgi:tetratricopeptide (TPR) repeat protein